MAAALALGVQEINDAGGVNGRRVRVIAREEGDDPGSAGIAIQGLIQFGVDAIIGPTSSINTLGTLKAAAHAGVLTCSPTASALTLDQFPADGLFFRTIASDSLQAKAIASAVEASGSSTAAVVYLDDQYGRPFGDAVEAALTARGTNVALGVGFTANAASIADAVVALVATEPDVVVVIADSTTGPVLIKSIDDALGSPMSYIVNDAIRRPSASAQPFSPGLALRITGVAPLTATGDTRFAEALAAADPAATGPFAHNAYDCLNIIALAAAAIGSDDPRLIATAITGVTASGSNCDSFPSCSVALDEGRNINYDGPSGNLSIDPNGNVVTADFDRFTFDTNGRDITAGRIAVGNG